MKNISVRHSLQQTLISLAGLTVAIAWLVPNHYPPWMSFYNESCAALGVVLLALTYVFAGKSSGIPRAALIVILVSAIPWLQYLLGILRYSGDAWVSSLYTLGLASAITVGYQWCSLGEEKIATVLAAATLVAACISSVIGLIQSLHGGVLEIWSVDGPPGMRAMGNLGQPNHAALLIAMGSLSLLYIWERRLLTIVPTAFLLGLSLLGAGLTQSRAALLFGPLIVLAVCFFRKKAILRTEPLIVFVAVAVHWFIAWSWPYIQQELLLSGSSTIAERGIQSSRYQAWLMFAEAVMQSPLVGYGWLQTGAAQFEIADQWQPVGELFSQSHNLPLELVVWSGIPLGICLFGCIAYWFVSRAFNVSTLGSVCGFLIACVLAVHSTLEFPEQYAYFLLPVALWIGLVEYSTGSTVLLSPRWSVVLFVTTAALFFTIFTQYLIIEADFRLARFEYLKIGSMRASKPDPDAKLLSNLNAYVRFYRMTPKTDVTERDLTDLRDITRRYPYAKLLYGYSTTLALNGQLEEAQRVFFKIRFIHGDRIYRILRSDVLERVVAGQEELQPFAALLPE